jgi:hypothetical protein
VKDKGGGPARTDYPRSAYLKLVPNLRMDGAGMHHAGLG